MPNALEQIRNLLTQIAIGEGDPKAHADHALVLMGTIRPTTASPLLLEHRGASVEYVVEAGVNGDRLTERRKAGKAQPFRCPKSIYDAMVIALSNSDRPLALDEIVAAVGKVTGDQPPEFQIRVPLRLWMYVDPPLLVRNRARYRPVDDATFATSTNGLWNSLRK